MSNDASPNCPQCGSPIPDDAPAGLCPNCLMALNLRTETAFPGDPAVAPPPLTPEQLAPHFPQLEILACLGRGGMGVVYQARQKSLNRFAALKLLAPERVADAEFARRFTSEAQALAKLNHPSIVTIYDFGQAGGFYFLLMEFVDGVNLRRAMKAGRFTPEQALGIVPPVCEALQYAHEHGIVHRDIKPENLLLDKDGRVKIADFGVAKMLDADGPDVGLEESQPAGTPQYMAPEQKERHRADHRADIYSLGVVLYEMLTGELPTDTLQPPSRKVRIDVRLDEIVLRALEKTPELRYQTAAEFRTQVETVVATPSVNQRKGRADLKWNAGALFGSTFGMSLWMPVAAMLSDWGDAGIALGFTSAGVIVATALWVWNSRRRTPAIQGYLLLLAAGFAATLVFLLAADWLGLTLRSSWPGGTLVSPLRYLWSLGLFPLLAAWLLWRHGKSGGGSPNGMGDPLPANSPKPKPAASRSGCLRALLIITLMALAVFGLMVVTWSLSR